MMKKVAILHASNTFNNGSFMLLINTISFLRKKHKDLTLYIEWNTDEDKHRILEETQCHDIIQELKLDICKTTNKSLPAKLINLYHKIFSHGSLMKKIGIEEVVILGGDDFSEYYKGGHIIFDLWRIKNYSKHLKVKMPSQSIGPFYGLRQWWARRCLANTEIYCREAISYDYCREELGLKNVHLSADLALLDLIKQKEVNTASSGSRSVVIVPGGHYKLYTSNYELYIKQWLGIITVLLETEALKDMKLLLLPHVTRPEDDRHIIKEICHRTSSDRIQAVTEEKKPSELRALIGASYFTVTSRMHPAISAFNQGKAAIVMAHSIKYHGIISQAFGLNELVVNEKAWQQQSAVEDFASALNYLLTYIESIEKDISLKTGNYKETLSRHMQDI